MSVSWIMSSTSTLARRSELNRNRALQTHERRSLHLCAIRCTEAKHVDPIKRHAKFTHGFSVTKPATAGSFEERIRALARYRNAISEEPTNDGSERHGAARSGRDRINRLMESASRPPAGHRDSIRERLTFLSEASST